MLEYCYWDPLGLQWQSIQNKKNFIHEMHFKTLFAKWQPFCSGGDELRSIFRKVKYRSSWRVNIMVVDGLWIKGDNGDTRKQGISSNGIDLRAHAMEIICWVSRALNMWNSNGPKQILKGPSTEILYVFINFRGPLGPLVKFHKDPILFQTWTLDPGARSTGIFWVYNDVSYHDLHPTPRIHNFFLTIF